MDKIFTLIEAKQAEYLEAETIISGAKVLAATIEELPKDFGMRKYQLVCSDLDGTLLNSEAEVSLENLRAIEKLAEQGVFFVPSTGRSYSEVPAEIRSHPSIRYFICSNGAMVMDGQSGRSHLTGMSRQISQKIQAILGRYETHLTLRHDGKCYVDAASATEEAFDYYNVCEAHRLVINDFAVWHEHFTEFCENTDDVEVISVFFKHREELMAAREEIESLGGLQVVGVSDYNLEIMNAKAGKGNALLWLAEELGIKREDTISVGDSDNDRSMVKAAGLGLAVSNACQSLKEAADEIICSNDEHAIQYIVEKLQ